MFAAGVAKKPIDCSDIEFLTLRNQEYTTCGDYLRDFVRLLGGRVDNPLSKIECKYCSYANTDALLDRFNIKYRDKWVDFGVQFVFIAFNIAATFAVYWLARVTRKQKMVET